MKINILPIKKMIGSAQSFSFTTSTITLELAETTAGRCEAAPVQVNVEIVNNGQSLEIQGQVRAVVRYICSRCLEEFDREIVADFSERYQERPVQESTDLDITEANYYQGDEIDITGLVRESLLLSEPLQPVCNEDCRGLCPECGVNRNQETCSCQQQAIDPRLMALQKFVKQ
ncbi:MAG TPA: DUF177 domain-containing protein [Patescibacteria group bacterium]|nr:DUF177 domain-containing protein [Patescibacteria group bacterium]